MRLALVFLFPFFVFGSVRDELGRMTLEEKVGQLFIAPGCPLHDETHLADWARILADCHIGSVIVKQSGVDGPGRFLNTLQGMAERPLFVVSDSEWGLSMTVEGALVFPRNMTLGAVQDLGLIEAMGAEIGREARRVGIHMNLAPVVDVNSNPLNPIIGMRSFGDDPERVAERGDALIRGMKKAGVMSCAKHFPGHGDTAVDSHYDLPLISRSKESLELVELVPFKSAIAAGVDGVMSAHILLPELDDLPATLSGSVMSGLLRDELGFDGLILTDALNMRALSSSRYSAEEIVLKAHAAGADLLLYGNHVFSDVNVLLRETIPEAYGALLKAYRDGVFSLDRLDGSVLKILEAKERFKGEVAAVSLDKSRKAEALQKKLYQASVTQIGPDFAPLDPDTAYLAIGEGRGEDILFSAFCPCLCSTWNDREDVYEYDRVVISLRGIQAKEKNYGLTEEQLAFFEDLSSKKPVVFCLFGTPYAARLLPQSATILVGFEEEGQDAVLSILAGESKPIGVLPSKLF